MPVATTKLVLTDNFADKTFTMDPEDVVYYARNVLRDDLMPEAEPDELKDYQATATKLGDKTISLSDRVQEALEVLEIVNIYEEDTAGVLLQQKLSALLIRAQTALAMYARVFDDESITVRQFKKMIAKVLENNNIPATDQSVLAVAEWTATCVEDNGIRIAPAIEQSIKFHVDELTDNN